MLTLCHVMGNPETTLSVAQILMVYRKNTSGFEPKVASDIPFLKIESSRGPRAIVGKTRSGWILSVFSQGKSRARLSL